MRPGTRREALLFSIGAKRTHGLRRTNADKEHVVILLLEDDEWSKWSARKLAEITGVSHDFVAKCKRKFQQLRQKAPAPVLTERNGTVYEINPMKSDSQEQGERMWHMPAIEKLRTRLVNICRDYMVVTALKDEERTQALSVIRALYQEVGDIFAKHNLNPVCSDGVRIVNDETDKAGSRSDQAVAE